MTDIETAVPLEDILKILGWSRSKFFRKKKELERYGIIFYRREGRPPVRKMYAFPSRILKYFSIKASQGEVV